MKDDFADYGGFNDGNDLMTSCDKGSSSPFPLCPDALADLQNYPFMLLSAILDTEQCNVSTLYLVPVVTDSS